MVEGLLASGTPPTVVVEKHRAAGDARFTGIERPLTLMSLNTVPSMLSTPIDRMRANLLVLLTGSWLNVPLSMLSTGSEAMLVERQQAIADDLAEDGVATAIAGADCCVLSAKFTNHWLVAVLTPLSRAIATVPSVLGKLYSSGIGGFVAIGVNCDVLPLNVFEPER